MQKSRREFLKTTAGAGASLAIPPLVGVAQQRTSPAHDRATTGLPARTLGEVIDAQAYNLGPGSYPGSPAENFSPVLVPDTSGTYRNLALLRPAFASSSYDYNLTAQLITDGIKETRLPDWIVTVVNGEVLPKQERDGLLNHFPVDIVNLPGAKPTVELHLGGGVTVPEVNRIGLFVAVPETVAPATLSFTVAVSDDGHLWEVVGSTKGSDPLPPENYPPDLVRATHLLAPVVTFKAVSRARFYRVELSAEGESEDTAQRGWRLGQVEFYRGAQRVQIGGPYSFTSAWKSAGLDEEWVYVDLGVRLTFDRVTLSWIARAASGKLQVSDDATVWQDVRSFAGANGLTDDFRLSPPAQGRYVRVLMTQPASEHGYILSEMEVFGRGGFQPEFKPRSAVEADGRRSLAGGNWRLHRSVDTSVQESGEAFSTPGFRDADWVVATVPGTVLTSYLNVGAIPDPNFGQNQLHISDSFFYADFWYRTEFVPTALSRDQISELIFEGVNWKAEVYLNGQAIGHVDGGFLRGRFDVSRKLIAGKPNALAVRVLRNATPGSCKQKTFESTGKNGGALGADNPTYHASIGWDWIPTIRGRNTGLWGDVYLCHSGVVTLDAPLVSSKLPLPSVDRAEISLEVEVLNRANRAVTGTLRGRFGTVVFEQPVKLAAAERQVVRITPATHPQLSFANPELWWPVGYGEPHLYEVELSFDVKGKTLHRRSFRAGIRELTYSEDGGALRMWINGRRFIARGGNWGFSESMLRYRGREYDAAVRYHREMNFTMLRNWVGQIGDEAFYEACDRHGLVVWQDFWLANPWDGPVPEDNALFLANARDFLLRIRQHASIGLYCGRNEWYPPDVLEHGLRALLAELHPGIHYIGSSADGPVSGHGPYHALTAPEYFHIADTKLHSEIGAPAIPSLESIRAMMPPRALWPQALDWGLHDFTLAGAQGGTAFRTLIDEGYGGAGSAEEWVALAQFVTYDTYRAMFESQSQHRMGLLLWMSHPCWPSFVWQTYDFYLEPTSAYFGCKKGSEPLHIQWNSLQETIEVVNYNAGSLIGLEARVEVLNMDGRMVMQKTVALDSVEDSVSAPIPMEYPSSLTPVHFLRLSLTQSGRLRSSNFYLRATEQGDYRAIRTLGKARVSASTEAEAKGSRWHLVTTLQNHSSTPALMVRMQAVRERSDDRILPLLMQENFFALMPGESRTVETEMLQADTRGEKPRIVIDGYNVEVAREEEA